VVKPNEGDKAAGAAEESERKSKKSEAKAETSEKAEISRRMMGKIRRTFGKANMTANDGPVREYALTLTAAGVKITREYLLAKLRIFPLLTGTEGTCLIPSCKRPTAHDSWHPE
jgi:hypothetical protein